MTVPGVDGRPWAAAAARVPWPDRPPEDYYDVRLQDEALATLEAVEPLAPLRAAVLDALSRPPHAVVVEGLMPDAPAPALVALNRVFGPLVSKPLRKPRSMLLHHVQPTTDLTVGRRPYSEELHVDGADWPVPPELMGLFCVRPDATGGGRSVVLPWGAVRDRLPPKHRAALRTPVPWKLDAAQPDDIAFAPILSDRGLRWRRYTMDAGYAFLNTTPTPAQQAAFTAVDEVVTAGRGALEFALGPGDWLLADNRRVLHARTPVAPAEASRRLMIRTWIRAPH